MNARDPLAMAAGDFVRPASPTTTEPLVSIGLPVYNSLPYLDASIESLLAQTYRNVELVISDNASTDGTDAVCRAWASKDNRVVYTRLDENIGGVRNHNRVFELAKGAYFMWASGDDLWRPMYVEKCVAALRAAPDVVVAYAMNTVIDENDAPLRTIEPGPSLDIDDVVERFRRLTNIYRTIEPFYGVIRAEALRRTPMMKLHPGFDRILFAELGLLGKLHQIKEPLYVRREHRAQSVGAYPSLRSRYRWVNPKRARFLVFPHLEYVVGFASAALRSAPSIASRLACLGSLAKWMNWHREELWSDLWARG